MQIELPFEIQGFCADTSGKDCKVRRKTGRQAKLQSWQVCPQDQLAWLKCGKEWQNVARK